MPFSPKKVKFKATLTSRKNKDFASKPSSNKRVKLPEVSHRAHRAYQPLVQIDFSQQLRENRGILAGSLSSHTLASNESNNPGVTLRKVIFQELTTMPRPTDLNSKRSLHGPIEATNDSIESSFGGKIHKVHVTSSSRSCESDDGMPPLLNTKFKQKIEE